MDRLMSKNEETAIKAITTVVIYPAMYKIIGTFVDIVPQRKSFERGLLVIGKLALVSVVAEIVNSHVQKKLMQGYSVVEKAVVDTVTDEE
jgi:hypothetical protein